MPKSSDSAASVSCVRAGSWMRNSARGAFAAPAARAASAWVELSPRDKTRTASWACAGRAAAHASPKANAVRARSKRSVLRADLKCHASHAASVRDLAHADPAALADQAIGRRTDACAYGVSAAQAQVVQAGPVTGRDRQRGDP